MSARPHLKLIVSETAPRTDDAPTRDRASLVCPVSLTRLRLRWLRAKAPVALALAAGLLLLLTALLALRR
jgi:hypothetical protein